MNIVLATSARWRVSAHTDGEVLAAGASGDDLEFQVAGFPDRFTPEEISGWLNDLVSVSRETSQGDLGVRSIPPLLHHALTGLLFSHAELWETDALSRPCSVAFVRTDGDVAFGWVGEALVEVWVDDGPLEAPFTRVRDEQGREALGVAVPPRHRVRVRLTWSALPGAIDAPSATIEAEWPGAGTPAADAEDVPGWGAPAPDSIPAPPAATAVSGTDEAELAAALERALSELPATSAAPGLEEPVAADVADGAGPHRHVPAPPASPESAVAATPPDEAMPAASGPVAEAGGRAAPRGGWIGRITSWLRPRRRAGSEPESAPVPPAPPAPAAPALGTEPESPQHPAGNEAATRTPAAPAGGEAEVEPAQIARIGDEERAALEARPAGVPPPGYPAEIPVTPPLAPEMFAQTPPPPRLAFGDPSGEDPHVRVLAPPAGSPAGPPVLRTPSGAERAPAGPPVLRVSPASSPAAPAAAGPGIPPLPLAPLAPRTGHAPEADAPGGPPVLPVRMSAGPPALVEAARDDVRPVPLAASAAEAPAAASPPPGAPPTAEDSALAAALSALAAETEAALGTRHTTHAPPAGPVAPEVAPAPAAPAWPAPPAASKAPPTLGAVDAMRAALDAARAAVPRPGAGTARPQAPTGPLAPEDVAPAVAAPPAPVAAPEPAPEPADAAPAAVTAEDAAAMAPADAAHGERVPLRPEWPSAEDLERPTPLWRRPWAWGVLFAALFAGGWLVGQAQDDRHGGPRGLGALARGLGLGGARFDVVVSSRPPGAWIAVDGKPLARRTPTTVDLPPGEHELTLSFSDLGGATFKVRGARGDRVTLDAPLWGAVEIHAADGSLPVTVTFDGREVGFAPVRLDSVLPGPHDLRFSGPGMPAWGQTVDVRVGERTQIVARPMTSPSTGVLEVRATITDEEGTRDLNGAAVWIDGEPRGSTPLSLELPRGPHSVRVARGGEQAPVQVIDLPGGNQRFATFELGLGAGRPRMATVNPPARVQPGESPVLSAAIEGVTSTEVREMWLHVRTPEGAWRRYQMALLRSPLGGVVGVAVFPAQLYESGDRARWYASVSMTTGDEYFTEIASLDVGTPRPATR